MNKVPRAIQLVIESTVKVMFFPYSYYNKRKLLVTAKRNEKIFLGFINSAEVVLNVLAKQNSARAGFKCDWDLAASSFFAGNLALDLNTAVLIAAASWRKQKKDFIWRTVAVTLYEGISQYSKFVMPVLFKYLKYRDAEPELLARHRNCAKRLGQVSKDYGAYLHNIRNNCMAHREMDYARFKEARRSVSEVKLMQSLTDFASVEQEVLQIFGIAFQRATQAL